VRLTAGPHSAYPIVDTDRLVWIVARGDVLRDDCTDDETLLDYAITVRPATAA
jgi:hypothetical protein